MRGWVVTAGVTALLALMAGRDADTMPLAGDSESCADFLPQAERQYDIPQGLLHAVALTESGNGGQPHPWTLNIAGQPRIAETYAAAALLLRHRDGSPRQDTAVGCMQIHMRYHLANIETPEWVLRPRNNVWYAAGFLRQLYDQYGSWRAAVAHYNASDPTAQGIYLCQVSRALARTAPGLGRTLGFPENCAVTGRALASSLSLPQPGGGWGRVVVGYAPARSQVPAGGVSDEPAYQGRRFASGVAVLHGRGKAARVGRGCAVAAPDRATGPRIIRSGSCPE